MHITTALGHQGPLILKRIFCLVPYVFHSFLALLLPVINRAGLDVRARFCWAEILKGLRKLEGEASFCASDSRFSIEIGHFSSRLVEVLQFPILKL